MRAVARFLALAALAAAPLIGGNAGCAQRPPVTLAVIPPGELPDLHKAGLAQSWQRQVPLDPGESISNVWRVGLSVYVATSNARIVRIEAKTGVMKWSQGLGTEVVDIFRPIELKNPAGGSSTDVLVVTHSEGYRFNIETGDETRPADHLGASVSFNPVVIGNSLIVGGADSLYGLYLDRPDFPHWVVKSPGDMFDTPPVPAGDGDMLVASREGHLWRISADDGNWVWKDRKANGEVAAGLFADSNAMYVPSLNQRVYAFLATTGGELWETQLAGRLDRVPAAAGSQIVVLSKENGAYALARSDGQVKWQAPDVSYVLTSDDDSVWVSDESGNIESLADDDGAVLAKAPTQGIGIFVHNTTDKSVILATRGGLVGLYVREMPVKSD